VSNRPRPLIKQLLHRELRQRVAELTGIEPASAGRQPASLTRCLQLHGLPGAIRTRVPAFGGLAPIHLAGRSIESGTLPR